MELARVRVAAAQRTKPEGPTPPASVEPIHLLGEPNSKAIRAITGSKLALGAHPERLPDRKEVPERKGTPSEARSKSPRS